MNLVTTTPNKISLVQKSSADETVAGCLSVHKSCQTKEDRFFSARFLSHS